MSKWQRAFAVASFLLLAAFAILTRYYLFSAGILYGEAAAKTASLLVAGIIIAAGYLPLRMLRSHDSAKDVPQETVAATLAAVLGLALAGYSVSQLLAPNTPVAAAAPACGGTPVYGSRFFAKTPQNGVNARKGPGVQYPQINRYGGNCTLGFDGYCIGPPVHDLILNSLDQRWLIVHQRAELVAAGVVLSQSAESALGVAPSPRCKQLGGLPQPASIRQFSYDAASGRLSASAPGAVAVGYGLATAPQHDRSYQIGKLATQPGFPAVLTPGKIASEMQVTGGVWLATAICLADGIPVTASLRVTLLTFHGAHIARQRPGAIVPASVRPLLAETACNGTGL